MTDLVKQIAAEYAQIQNAPQTPVSQLQPQTSGMSGRCSWCGRVSDDLEAVHDMLYPHGIGVIVNERYKGRCCRGS